MSNSPGGMNQTAYADVGTSGEITVPLGGPGEYRLVGVFMSHTAGSATTWQVELFDVASGTADADRICSFESASISAGSIDHTDFGSAGKRFYTATGDLFIQPNFDTGSDNDGIVRVDVERLS